MIRMAGINRFWAVMFIILTVSLSCASAPVVWASGSGVEAEAEGHGEAADHGEAASGKGWDLLWRTLNFIILMVVLVYILRKPLSQFFRSRRENIAQTLTDFEEKQAAAEDRFKELEGKLADLTAERDKILAEYIKEGEDEKEKIIANAQEMAERIKDQAEVSIKHEIKSAKQELMREIANLSTSMAEDLIRKDITDQDQKRLLEEYLEKVVQN